METGQKLRFGEKLSYGMGDFGYGLIWNAVGAFLLYYYTNVALLSAAAVGTLFLTARLFDALIDLGVGVMVDRTRTRWGRTRPYFLLTGIPFCIVFVLTFMVPDLSYTGKLIYAFVTFNLLGILFSLGSVPYSALLPMMTAAPGQRLQLSSMRSIGTAASVIVATAATMPLVGALGGGNESRGFFLTALLFGVISLLLIYNLFFNTREGCYDQAPVNFNVLGAVRDMLRNRAWLVTFLFCTLNFVRFGVVLSVTAFFAIEVLRAPWMISILLPAVSGTLLLGAFIAPPILRRTGIRRGCVGAILVAIVLYVMLPFVEATPPLFLTLFISASIAISVTMTAIFAMAADSVDYHEWLYSSRNEGLLSSGISLATKIGMAVGTAVVAYTLAIAGYAPGEVSEGARFAIRWTYYGWPVAVLAIQCAVILWWPMDGMHARIREEVGARNRPEPQPA